ncbi:MAG: glutamate formimidoyltransferase [Acidimicrobiia bacterium]|nr:glutamate formimidoyltransferase [Acidimicrobiia bacterium]
MQLIECVPNFSEGRDQGVIKAITDEIVAVPGAELLDVDPGADTNRTVVTFVGDSDAVAEAAFRSIAKAAELIDMRSHEGAHPRMGATDVCPFIPVQGVTMQECVALARDLAARVGSELGIPVYLYEHAAGEGRRSLSDARRGEYEGLADRPDRPDFGPDLHPSAGATAIGAREFLIAYNVNVNTTDRRLAHQVAQAVRELGTPKRDESGKIVKGEDGKTVFIPGRFKECKAVGWYLAEYGRAQVSINLTDYNVTSLHDVFDACREEAAARGMRVTGSELVGLVPRAALLAAGDHYLAKQGRSTGVPEEERIRIAILSLGLDELGPFEPKEKVVEYRVSSGPGNLAGMTVTEFLNELSTDSPAPGGGSVAALCGSLAASLTAMVAALTHAKKGFEDSKPAMNELGHAAQNLKGWFVAAIDRDTDAFNGVLAAIRLPRKTEADRAIRDEAMAAANLRATLVPLEVLERCVVAMGLAHEAAADGNPNSVSDAGVAAACAKAAARAASLNVRINLPGLGETEQQEVSTRHDTALAQLDGAAAEVTALVDQILAASS